jgi:ATP-dependent Clp protease ATP-binding subunit ClpA
MVEHLADVGYDSKMGARPLGRKIDELIRVPLSRKILFDRLQDCEITADYRDGTVSFSDLNPIPSTGTVGADGIIQVD